jgi:cytosine/creatinine deaminase
LHKNHLEKTLVRRLQKLGHRVILEPRGAEADAFRKAGREPRYRDKIMVTTLAPCWLCSGLVRQFRIGTLVIGESLTFSGGVDWLREAGEVIDFHS